MQKYANLVEPEKCCRTHIFLQNFVLIQPRTSSPKICKILQKISKIANFAKPNPLTGQVLASTKLSDARRQALLAAEGAGGVRHGREAVLYVCYIENGLSISAKCCSFSAVSAPIFASKYAFCSILQNLPDYLAEIFEIWQIIIWQI